MKRRRVLVIGLAVALIITTGALLLYVARRGPISHVAYEQIRVGMTEEDVQAVLVLPPGNHATDFYTAVGKEEQGQKGGGSPQWWTSNIGMIEVEFDAEGKVCWKAFHRL